MKWHAVILPDEDCQSPREWNDDKFVTHMAKEARWDDDKQAHSPLWAYVLGRIDATPARLRRAGMKPRKRVYYRGKGPEFEDAEHTVERWLDEQGWSTDWDLVELVLDALCYPYAFVDGERGRIAVAFIEPGAWRGEYGWKRLTAERKRLLQNVIDSEVKTFELWLRGECYGYIAYSADKPGREIREESCWGFIGDWYHAQQRVAEYATFGADDVVWHETRVEAEEAAEAEQEALTRKWFAGEIGGAFEQEGQECLPL